APRRSGAAAGSSRRRRGSRWTSRSLALGDRDLGDRDRPARRATQLAGRVVLVEAEDLLHHVETQRDLAERDVRALSVEDAGLRAGHEEVLRTRAVRSLRPGHHEVAGRVLEALALVRDRVARPRIARAVGRRPA